MSQTDIIADLLPIQGLEDHLQMAGVDEAGRGPLAGPVVAAAVILPPQYHLPGLTDSKQLTAIQRESLYADIVTQALAWSVGRAEVEEIDRLDIFRASLLAMQRAILALAINPQCVFVDGRHCPKIPYPCIAIIEGDSKIPAISAASVIAKVTRDREMTELDKQYPQYGFAEHKGYSTAKHLQTLKEFGASPLHRQSFAPVREVLPNRQQSFETMLGSSSGRPEEV